MALRLNDRSELNLSELALCVIHREQPFSSVIGSWAGIFALVLTCNLRRHGLSTQVVSVANYAEAVSPRFSYWQDSDRQDNTRAKRVLSASPMEMEMTGTHY